MDRREFLKILGATSAGFLENSCGTRYQRLFDVNEDYRTYKSVSEKYINTICQVCPAGCGIQVRVVNENVVRINGNPLSPINRGKVCLRGASGTQHLYNPRRIKNPLKLIGKKGSGNFQQIGWDEALGIITERLRKLREDGEPQKVSLITNYQRGLLDRLFHNFFRAYGSPNYLKISPETGLRMVIKLMHGAEGSIGYDLENANYILNFGINLFESSASPVWYNWLHGYLRRTRHGSTAKLVHISPLRSISAIKSNEWININPGTSGALALGIANILLKRNLHNIEFISSHTFGFEDWTNSRGTRNKGFKSLILEKYDTQKVSDITGVPIHDIDRIAREFAENQPSIAIFDDTIAQYTGGIYSQMAIHSLNALVGNINNTGGIICQQEIPYTNLPAVKIDLTAARGLAHQRVDRAQSAEFPMAQSVMPNLLQMPENNKIDTMFIYNCNPLYTFSEYKRYESLFQSTPCIVYFSSFYDETVPFCDFILPVPTYLEKWEDVPTGTQTGFNQVLGIMKPVISPLYNTKSVGDIFLHLAKNLGPPINEALPWDTFEDLLRHSLKGIFSSRSGMIYSGIYEKGWAESLEKFGWQVSTYTTFDEFWKQIVESGGWWNPILSNKENRKLFQTPSGKFEFFSQTLLREMSEYYKKDVNNPQQLTGIIQQMTGTQAADEEIFMPHHEPLQFSGNSSEFPLLLYPFETGALQNGAINSSPILMGLLNIYGGEKWESWAEINPETAQKYNLQHDEEVWIESLCGKIKTTVKISDRIVPGVLGIPFGLGHTENLYGDKTIGVNPNCIIVANVDRLGGIDLKKGTRVKIYRV